MKNLNEKACLCALNKIFGFEPKLGRALIDRFGTASNVFMLKEKETDSLFGPGSRYHGKICAKAIEEAERELIDLNWRNIQFCGITEPDYPWLLKECVDAPVGLYIRSSTPVANLWDGRSIAVVGTRDISPYGKEWCRKVVKGLSSTSQQPSIISGLALGVDIEAHRTAVECGLRTIAVMATGPEAIYPHRHRDFAEQLVHTPGCALITDYPPDTAPLAVHFLRRNRIIAGLSESVILIESKIKGGGLMTCNLAFSYNRDVYALPGRADDLRSMGCNELIRTKIAEPITSVESLINTMGMCSLLSHNKSSDIRRVIYNLHPELPEEERTLMEKVLNQIRKVRGSTVEEISEATGIGYRRTLEITAILEIDGIISLDLMQRCSFNAKFV